MVCALSRQAHPLHVVGKRQGRGAAEQVELEILPRADRRAVERKSLVLRIYYHFLPSEGAGPAD